MVYDVFFYEFDCHHFESLKFRKGNLNIPERVALLRLQFTRL